MSAALSSFAPAYMRVARSNLTAPSREAGSTDARGTTSSSAKNDSMREIDTRSWRMRMPKPGIWFNGPRTLR